jgi:hypothetical protein
MEHKTKYDKCHSQTEFLTFASLQNRWKALTSTKAIVQRQNLLFTTVFALIRH